MRDPIGAALYALTLLPFLSCALAYGRSEWRRHPVGRVLMGLLAATCAVLILGIVARVAGDDNFLLILRVTFLGLLNAAGWSLFVQIKRLQSRHLVHPLRRATDRPEGRGMSSSATPHSPRSYFRQFAIDATERAVKTAAQAMLLVFGADAFDLLAADWDTALSFGGGGLVVSYLTSLLSLRLGQSGTASMTDAVVPAPAEHDDSLRA